MVEGGNHGNHGLFAGVIIRCDYVSANRNKLRRHETIWIWKKSGFAWSSRIVWCCGSHMKINRSLGNVFLNFFFLQRRFHVAVGASGTSSERRHEIVVMSRIVETNDFTMVWQQYHWCWNWQSNSRRKALLCFRTEIRKDLVEKSEISSEKVPLATTSVIFGFHWHFSMLCKFRVPLDTIWHSSGQLTSSRTVDVRVLEGRFGTSVAISSTRKRSRKQEQLSITTLWVLPTTSGSSWTSWSARFK